MSNSISVEVRPLKNVDLSKGLRAMAKVTVNGIEINNCRVFEKKDNTGTYFVGMPQEKNQKSGKWFDTVRLPQALHDEVSAVGAQEYAKLLTEA